MSDSHKWKLPHGPDLCGCGRVRPSPNSRLLAVCRLGLPAPCPATALFGKWYPCPILGSSPQLMQLVKAAASPAVRWRRIRLDVSEGVCRTGAFFSRVARTRKCFGLVLIARGTALLARVGQCWSGLTSEILRPQNICRRVLTGLSLPHFGSNHDGA